MNRRHGAQGFTLVELLVALAVLAIMSVMAWQGMDALIRSREGAQAALEQTSRLQTVLAQWERDLREVQDPRGSNVEPLSFDGSSMLLTRRQADGLQVVAWTVRDGALYRWASPALRDRTALVAALRQAPLAATREASAIKALEGVVRWQMYFFRGNAWSNALSAGDDDGPPSSKAPPAAGAASAPSGAASAPLETTTRRRTPSGVRVVLEFTPEVAAGPLQRQVLVGGGS